MGVSFGGVMTRHASEWREGECGDGEYQRGVGSPRSELPVSQVSFQREFHS